MSLMIDPDSRQVRQFVGPCCDTEAERTWANVSDGSAGVAVYFASCYRHDGVHEAWIDVVLGTWGAEDFSDHLTFGCRVGPVSGAAGPAA